MSSVNARRLARCEFTGVLFRIAKHKPRAGLAAKARPRHRSIDERRPRDPYGVTMAERGVSQLVSVDLEGAVKLREAS